MDDQDQDLPLTVYPRFSLGDCRVDPPALRIERAGTSQRVEAKVMQVLLALARKPGHVVSREELVQEVWPGRIVTDDAATNAVVKLRKALDDNPRKPRLIETISKSGYRLMVEPVIQTADSAALPALAAKTTARRRPWPWRLRSVGTLVLIAIISIVTLMNWREPKDPMSTAFDRNIAASIAVIPFDVLDEDASQSYFAEGITLDLITELSLLPELLVIAPGTVFGYRETTVSDHAIAAELGVLYLIRGGVQRIGEQVRINVRLLEAESGHTLWARRFAGETSRLFQIQDEVVAGIASALPVSLSLSGEPLQRGHVTESIAAYEELLRGQEYDGRRTPEDNRIARLHFERAVALDPAFARAYAGLALVWSRPAIDGWTANPDEALARAEEYAQKAASIDPSIPQIHFVLAQVELFRGRHDQAAAEATTAIRLDPNYADAYALLAWILHYAGRPDRAKPALDEALRRNPSSSASYREIAGEIFFATGRYEDAVREFEAALERNPAHMRARLWLAATLTRLGHQDEAAWETQELLAINPELSLSHLLLAFPLKDPRQLDALKAVLREMGLPE